MMSVLWMRARAQLRGRVGPNLFLAVLVGLAGAMVLAATAGVRRSEAALPRFLAANQTVDAAVYVPPSSPSDDLAEARRRVAGRRPPSGPATTPRSPGSRPHPPPRWNHIQQAPGGTEPAGSGQ